MAGIFKRQNNKSFNSVSDIVFEGALLSDTRAVLITELIHYILYERQQIPLPVDQLKLRTYASNSNNECEVPQLNFKKHPAQNMVDRKAKVFLESLGQMCDNLKQSFRYCPEIEQVAILLGGSVVSPKESYIVKLPPPCPDADCLPLRSCKHTLFKQIISEDIVGSLRRSQLSPSNVMVLLSAPRSCPPSWFLPKHTVQSQTGTIISFNFRCVYSVPICHDLSLTECDLSNLSGLEPHGCTPCAVSKGCRLSGDICNGDDIDIQSEDANTHVSSLCNRKLGDLLSETAMEAKEIDVNNRTVVACEKLERFCEHKRLNYVFSAHKKRNNSIGHSSNDSPPISCQGLMNDSMDFCYTPGDKVYRDLVDSASHSKKYCDYIWYQSPLMLKGFKDHIAHEH